MAALAFGGSIVLAGVALTTGCSAATDKETADAFETAIKNSASKLTDKKVYTAVVCKPNDKNPFLMLPPDQKPVFLATIQAEESSRALVKSRFIRSDLVANNSRTVKFGFPAKAYFSSKEGPVHARDLEFATWANAQQDCSYPKTKDAAALLKRLGLIPNLDASYKIERTWFGTDIETVTIFADAQKYPKGGIALSQPMDKPFHVTTLSPEECVSQLRKSAAASRTVAKTCGFFALILGVGSMINQ